MEREREIERGEMVQEMNGKSRKQEPKMYKMRCAALRYENSYQNRIKWTEKRALSPTKRQQ